MFPLRTDLPAFQLITVPLYLKFGRRPIMLASILIYLAGLIGAGRSNSYGALMACRIVHTLASGVCEALPVALVNDIFFCELAILLGEHDVLMDPVVHERGTKLGYYTVCLCWGSTGPLYAGYMLAGGYSWRLYFYVETAFAGALFILAFFFVEETTYKRDTPNGPAPANPTGERKVFSKSEVYGEDEGVEKIEVQTLVPLRRSFVATLKPWSAVNEDEQFFLTMVRCFTYFLGNFTSSVTLPLEILC
jgi:MFS family permease